MRDWTQKCFTSRNKSRTVHRQQQLGVGALGLEQVDLHLGGAPEATSARWGGSFKAGKVSG